MKYIAFLVGVLLVPSLALAHHPGGNHILVSPAAMDYQAGKEMLLEVRLSAPEAITSFRIHLRYDTALLEVREIRTNTDTFPFWWSQKAVSALCPTACQFIFLTTQELKSGESVFLKPQFLKVCRRL